MHRFITLFAAAYIFGCSLLLQANAQQPRFITEELPPLSFHHKGTLTGYNIELLQLVHKTMGTTSETVTLQPWPRTIKNFDSQRPQCVFPVALTPERKKQYRFVESPARANAVLVAHNNAASRYNSKEQLQRTTICISSAASILNVLQQQGFNAAHFDYSTTLPGSIRKFMKGRAPLVGGSKAAIFYTYKKLGGLPQDLQVVWNISSISNGFLFNDSVPDEYISRFKKAMRAVANSPAHNKLYAAYFLNN